MESSNTALPPVPPLPLPKLTQPHSGISLLQPLSRRGTGPGLILVIPDLQRPILTIENGIPSPLIKWAEESYVLAAVDATALQSPSQTRELLLLASELLAASDSCEPKGRVGLIAYTPQSWDLVAAVLQDIPGIQAAVLYAAVEEIPNLGTTAVPTVQHLAGKAQVPLQRSKNFIAYDYPGASTSAFAVPFHPGFNYNADAISHSRNLMFLKEKMGGPYFDLEQIWDEHTYYEFENRSVEHTMSTMVQEPYVNHIPTLTGGIGREQLTAFYRDHFIWKNPKGTSIELISRTLGIDRVVDEFIFKFHHDTEVDWIIPGIAPTHRDLAIPFVAVVCIRGDRLYHEHITWDQGTVLAQLGCLTKTDGVGQPLPVWGKEICEKLRDKNSVESNRIFQNLLP